MFFFFVVNLVLRNKYQTYIIKVITEMPKKIQISLRKKLGAKLR